jgi:hypothetical protein
VKGVAIAAVALAALVVVAPAQAADADIETVTVSRSADDVVTFRIEFARPVALDDETQVQVAIDADRDPDTGIDGLEYSLDWSGSPALLTAVDGQPSGSHPASFGFEHKGATVAFSIAASDIGSPEQFDFYTFIDQNSHKDIAPVHELFSATWTYPSDDVAPGEPYPTETYEDIMDNTIVEGDWSGFVWLAAIVGGLLALGAVVALIGWSIERARKRRQPPAEPPAT